ncbi:ankyrin [Acephala macrosclerotiorum]|nr:ankyrin [Acephala macrosclerotiorum]
MDPLSITGTVIAILQIAGSTGQVLNMLLSLRDAPQQLQQLWNEAEALRAILLETECSLHRRRESDGYAQVEASITPVLQTVRAHVLEFEHLIHFRLTRSEILDGHGLPKVKRSYWLRAAPEIQRIKQNIRDSREILKSRLELLGLHDSEDVKATILQIQRITLTSQDAIRKLEDRQQELQHEFRQLGKHAQQSLEQTQAMYIEQRRNFATLQASFTTSMQSLLTQTEQMTLALNQHTQIPFHGPETSRNRSAVRISATIASQQCPMGCRCQCHTRTSIRTPLWLRCVFGQLLWAYSSSISMRSCNYPPCRKSLGKHHFTYYFPPWLVSRAVVASANLDDLFGAGAKVLVNIPLIIPEEDHIVWSLVIAGNLDQLRHLLSSDKNLMHVRNQWGQSIMHVAAKIHQPGVFNFLLSLGMDEHLPDENQKTATTAVLTRRGSQEYALTINADDLADRLGWTPLHKAAALTRESRQLTEALLESEYVNINSRDALGRTPLHWLAENGEADAIRLLTQDPWRADVHTRDNCGFTALHCACWADSFDSAAVLLDAGSNPNAKDTYERTPLLHFDNNKLLDLMLEKGANVYISDDEGANIMHHVAVADQAALAKTLLERYGHTLCIANHNGDTPLGLAIKNNSLDVLAVLLSFLQEFPVEKVGMSNQSKRNLLHLAALHASTEAMDMLAAADLFGLDPVAQDKDGHSPNECFMECRSAHCAVARKPFDVERKFWVRLMRSARGQTKVSLGVGDEDEEMGVMHDDICDKHKHSFLVTETSSDSMSEEEYVDAEDGNDKEDWP